MRNYVNLILFVLFVLVSTAQCQENSANWDNVLYASNKVSWGSENWKQYGDFQSRYNSDFGTLEQWHLEYAASYLANKHWEITPDFRFTRKQNSVEYRPGFGAVYKALF